MWIEISGLIISLCIILISCELFTNGIEWLGKKLSIGEGVIGSIFSAVGTCLPETLVPVIAILSLEEGISESNSIEVGIGAILGAPFMLSTLAFFISGLSVFLFWKKRKSRMNMYVNHNVLGRDMLFFIVVYSIGVSATFMPSDIVKTGIAYFLIACYVIYIIITVKNDRVDNREIDLLYIVRLFNLKPGLVIIMLQVAIALSGIAFGANLFIMNLEQISTFVGIPALVLSLIITPIATELPEKFNSIIWIRKKKDTLALGNISGAMVFQSCIPVSIGILFTPWNLEDVALMSALLAISSSIVLYLWMKIRGKLTPIPLLMGGALYIVYILYLFH